MGKRSFQKPWTARMLRMLKSMAPSPAVDALCLFWGDLLKEEVRCLTARLPTSCKTIRPSIPSLPDKQRSLEHLVQEYVRRLSTLAHLLSCTLRYETRLRCMLRGSAHRSPLALTSLPGPQLPDAQHSMVHASLCGRV